MIEKVHIYGECFISLYIRHMGCKFFAIFNSKLQKIRFFIKKN